jgi:long-chain fatty acid transport protein
MSISPRYALLFAALIALPGPARASRGFGLVENDAQTAAMHGGAAALIDNPAAAHLNPANLTLIDATTVVTTVNIYDVYSDFTAPNGLSMRSDKPIKPTGSLYLATPVGPKATLGVGIDSIFGTSMEWDPQGLFKYTAPYSGDFRMLGLVTSLGIKANENLRFGVELDVYRASLNLKQFFPWLLLTGNPATPDGAMEFDGDDICVSGGLSVSWTPAPGHHLAFVAHAPTSIHFEGDFTITNIPVPLPGVSEHSDFQGTLTMPGDLTLSYAWDVSDRTTVGAEVAIIGNSAVDKLTADVGGNNVLFPSTTTELNWHDSVALSLGLRQRLSAKLTFLAGYQYTESPMNETNYTPLIPGNNRHLVSLGVTYVKDHLSLGLGYNYGFHPDLVLTHNAVPAFNGTHEFSLQILSLSAGYRF